MSESAKVILDTNFIMIPEQVGLDIFDEIQKSLYKPVKLFVCSGTINELQKLTNTGKGSDKRAAKLALRLLDEKNIEIIDTKDKFVDDALVELSDRGYIVATQDLGLKKRLNKYLYMRQKKFIEIRGTAD